MNRTLAAALLTLGSCRAAAPSAPAMARVDAGHHLAAAPTWPADLVEGLLRIEARRTEPDGGARTSRLTRRDDGLWYLEVPRRGEADPDALARLSLALTAPQILWARATPGPFPGDQQLWLSRADGGTTHVGLERLPPGQPVRVVVEGLGEFLVSAVELPLKLPDPDDFLPAGLWVSAHKGASAIEVKTSKRTYRIEGRGEDWKMVRGKAGPHDLDDVPGVLTGRQACGHPEADAGTGLDRPDAVATLCAGAICREFRFGHFGGRYFAQGPDADPIELRDNDWRRVVEGP